MFLIAQGGIMSATYAYYIDKIHEGTTMEIKNRAYSCFELPSNIKNSCHDFNVFGDPSRSFTSDPNYTNSDIFTIINFFITKELAVFSNDLFFKKIEPYFTQHTYSIYTIK